MVSAHKQIVRGETMNPEEMREKAIDLFKKRFH